MAEEATKPAAKKRPAPKKGPTKAAALKALGLTQDDLATLRQVAQARELAEKTKTQQASKVEAFESITAPVLSPSIAAMPAVVDDTLFIRNLRNVEVGFRLERQQGAGKKRTELKGRGQRGDIKRIERTDLTDANLQTQISYGVVEVIGAIEANSVIAGQAHNQQQAVHPAMAMLRNELGQEYAPDSIRTEAEFNSQGVTVATLDPRQMQGQVPDKQVGRGEPVRRVAPGNANVAQVGGNPAILSDGFNPPDAAVQRDAAARQRLDGAQGPEAGLPAGMRVTVEPTQRT